MSFYKFDAIFSATDYVNFIQLHWLAAFKDALMVVILYIMVGVLVRNLSWGRKFNNKRIIIFLVLGLLWAIGIEYQAINASRWSYTTAMPVLPVLNVGILPLLQMLILPPISVLMARNQLRL